MDRTLHLIHTDHRIEPLQCIVDSLLVETAHRYSLSFVIIRNNILSLDCHKLIRSRVRDLAQSGRHIRTDDTVHELVDISSVSEMLVLQVIVTSYKTLQHRSCLIAQLIIIVIAISLSDFCQSVYIEILEVEHFVHSRLDARIRIQHLLHLIRITSKDEHPVVVALIAQCSQKILQNPSSRVLVVIFDI